MKTSSARRKFPVVGQVRDVDGVLWGVRDVRTTKHGFDLLFGSPVSRLGACVTGLPRIIATDALVAFWEDHRIDRNGTIYDLPAGRTTLKRVRRRLGFHSLEDLSEFWCERIADLQSLSVQEFAARHNVSADRTFDARLRILGPRARPIGWWQTPQTIAVLLSNTTLREVGAKLEIGTSHAKRLRDRARQQSRSLGALEPKAA